jgi:hypothetical protein
LAQATSGAFYGTPVNNGSGTGGQGSVFTLSVGLLPFVETLPNFGKIGATIRVLGTNLTGATGVIFNGKPATSSVESPTVIKATVPAGAITGKVQVVTPSHTLTSKVNFECCPNR